MPTVEYYKSDITFWRRYFKLPYSGCCGDRVIATNTRVKVPTESTTFTFLMLNSELLNIGAIKKNVG